MTPDQLAERIMDRIEKDQAIHKSSIVEELQLACAPARQVTQRDGYPIAESHAVNVTGFSAIDANLGSGGPIKWPSNEIRAEEIRKMWEALDQ